MSLVISEFGPCPKLRGIVRRAADYHERSAPLRRLEASFVGVVLIVSLGPDMEIDGRRTGSFVALAAEVGWSRRHLAARVRDELGLAPKALARLIRVEHAAQRVRAGEPLADVAYGSGYADQPHFNRDFRELVGCAPSEFPFVQDALAAA